MSYIIPTLSINQDVLRNLKNELGEPSDFLFPSKMQPEIGFVFNLGFPDAALGAYFFLRLRKIWFAKQGFVDPGSFGDPSQMDEVIRELASKAPYVVNLMKEEKYFQDNQEIWVKVIQRKPDHQGVYNDFEKDPKILVVSNPTLLTINALIASPHVGAPRIFHPDGVPLFMDKTGTGMQTRYSLNTYPGLLSPIPADLFNKTVAFSLKDKARELVTDPNYVLSYGMHILCGMPEPKRPDKKTATGGAHQGYQQAPAQPAPVQQYQPPAPVQQSEPPSQAALEQQAKAAQYQQALAVEAQEEAARLARALQQPAPVQQQQELQYQHPAPVQQQAAVPVFSPAPVQQQAAVPVFPQAQQQYLPPVATEQPPVVVDQQPAPLNNLASALGFGK